MHEQTVHHEPVASTAENAGGSSERKRKQVNGYEALCRIMLVASGNGSIRDTATALRELTDSMPDDAMSGDAPLLRACASKLEAWADRFPEQVAQVNDLVHEAQREVFDRKQAEYDAKLQQLAETDEQPEPDEFGDEVHDPGDEHGNAVEVEEHAA